VVGKVVRGALCRARNGAVRFGACLLLGHAAVGQGSDEVAGSAVCGWKQGPANLSLNGGASAMAVWNDGSGDALYVGGVFTAAGGVSANRIARWNGVGWSPLVGPTANGMNNSVNALAVFDDGSGPALYAAGAFTTAGGTTVNRVARWDGTRWYALPGTGGIGVDAEVWALAVYDDGSGPALFVGGNFNNAGGVPASRVARWDGSTWTALPVSGGPYINGYVLSLATHDDGSGPSLYVGGIFTQVGGQTVNKIARWNGATWSALAGPQGTGLEVGKLDALYSHSGREGNSLYAGGNFVFAGGIEAWGAGRWSGTRWWPMSGPSGTGINTFGANIDVFAEYSDGEAPALYAGGSFEFAGGIRVNRVARWNGIEWSALVRNTAIGTNSDVRSLASFDDGIEDGPTLYVGGTFTSAGGFGASRVARWWCPTIEPPPTPACVDVDIAIQGAAKGVGALEPVANQAQYNVTVSNLADAALAGLGLQVRSNGLLDTNWSCSPPASCQPTSGIGNAVTTVSLVNGGAAMVAVIGGVDQDAHFVEIVATAQLGEGYAWEPGCKTRATLIHVAGPQGIFKGGFE
jgi:hypothetical protein